MDKRSCKVIDKIDFVNESRDWTKMKSIIKIDSERFMKATGEIKKETRCYISCLAADVVLINKSVRNHCSVENKLHWMLDISFKKDSSKKEKITLPTTMD
ncbi:MAG: ISAs1 family transposase [Cytophagales bacterium]|nr:MAG: ISAs1 family transposase [Cytophagales bacterium]